MAPTLRARPARRFGQARARAWGHAQGLGDPNREAWASASAVDEDDPQAVAAFVEGIDRLAAERPPGDPVASFERASARDAAAREADAIELYEQALAGGLGPDRRRRAVIQLASSLRNVGRPAEGATLLLAERRRPPGPGEAELDAAVASFLSLCLVDSGRGKEAVAVALDALAGHVTLYGQAVARYAAELAAGEAGPGELVRPPG